jgi:serine protease
MLRRAALLTAAVTVCSTLPAAASSTVTLVALRWLGGHATEIERTVASGEQAGAMRELLAVPGVIAVDVDSGVQLSADLDSGVQPSGFRPSNTTAPEPDLSAADPDTSRQWGLLRLDRVELAKRRLDGTGVTVAVVDTGVDAKHPELAPVVLPGFDAFDPAGDGRIDPNGHGTHVAGVIASVRNASGVEGLAPGVKILPVRVLDATGYGEESDVARGVLWAVANGAQVINLSLGSDEPNSVLAAAVAEARKAGVAVIASAGNDGAAGSEASYPAADPGTYAVAATDAADRVAYFSTRGSYVDIAAPGVLVLSTWRSGTTRYESGTSMAAPYVSASVAVVMHARKLDAVAAADLLVATASDTGVAGKDIETGSGLVDPFAAATSAAARPLSARTSVTAPPAATLPVFDPKYPVLPAPNIPLLKPLPLPTLRPMPAVPFDSPSRPAPTPSPTYPNSPETPKPSAPKDRRDAVVMSLAASRSGSGVTVNVRLRSANGPLAGRPVTVTVAGLRRSAVTDAFGRVQLRLPSGKITASFAGDGSYRPVTKTTRV